MSHKRYFSGGKNLSVIYINGDITVDAHCRFQVRLFFFCFPKYAGIRAFVQ